MDANIVKTLTYYRNANVKRHHAFSDVAGALTVYDLTMVLSGSMQYIVDDKIVNLDKNDMIFFKPGDIRNRPLGKEPVNYISFNFDVYNPSILPKNRILRGAVTSEIRAILKAYTAQRLTDRYYSKEKLTNILNYIIFDILSSHSFGTSNKYVIETLKYIDAHLSQQLSLSEISQAVHISRDYLSHLFKTELHKPVIDYINEHKMLLAKIQIEESTRSLPEIATSLGYDNYSYFSRIFKKYIGKSPGYLRIKS